MANLFLNITSYKQYSKHFHINNIAKIMQNTQTHGFVLTREFVYSALMRI